VHIADAGQGEQLLARFLLHLIAHRAGHNGQRQSERDDIVIDGDVVNHAQLHDVSVQLGIHHPGKRLAYLFYRRHLVLLRVQFLPL